MIIVIVGILLLGIGFVWMSKENKTELKDPDNEIVDNNEIKKDQEEPKVEEKIDTGSSSSQNNVIHKPVESISFPYNIADSNLVILQFSSYQGSYLEDGLNQDIDDVASIMVCNRGEEYIEYALIRVHQGDNVYEFKACTLGPGEMMFVQDMNKRAYSNVNISAIDCDVAYIDSFNMLEDKIMIKEVDQGIEVTNKTNKDIPTVRLFYKLYMEEEKMYVGGITYVAKIENLKASSSIVVEPRHYFQGNSKIRMARIYE